MKYRNMDYHLHTLYSMDGKQSVYQLAQRAAELGLDEICLTEHIEPGHPSKGIDRPPDYPLWFKDIQLARESFPQLAIRAGIEIGDNPLLRRGIEAGLDALPLDYRLLSLHLVGGVDPYEPIYYEGKTQEEAYLEYVEAKGESILAFRDYDAVAHLGYVCKFAPYAPEIRPLRYRHAPEAFDRLLRFMAQEGKALEINASGLIQTDSPIPGPDLIRRFIELGGEFFVFGSDAHMTQRVYLNVLKAKEIALSQGARWQVGFTNRVMEVYKI